MDLHSKILDVCPPLGPIVFIFVKFSKVIGWHGTPPLENPGSTAENIGNNKSVPPISGGLVLRSGFATRRRG